MSLAYTPPSTSISASSTSSEMPALVSSMTSRMVRASARVTVPARSRTARAKAIRIGDLLDEVNREIAATRVPSGHRRDCRGFATLPRAERGPFPRTATVIRCRADPAVRIPGRRKIPVNSRLWQGTCIAHLRPHPGRRQDVFQTTRRRAVGSCVCDCGGGRGVHGGPKQRVPQPSPRLPRRRRMDRRRLRSRIPKRWWLRRPYPHLSRAPDPFAQRRPSPRRRRAREPASTRRPASPRPAPAATPVTARRNPAPSSPAARTRGGRGPGAGRGPSRPGACGGARRRPAAPAAPVDPVRSEPARAEPPPPPAPEFVELEVPVASVIGLQIETAGVDRARPGRGSRRSAGHARRRRWTAGPRFPPAPGRSAP